MSPRAAWRLERLGFPRVYDYVAGKMDWLSFGLPHQGNALLAGDIVHRGVPACDLDQTLGDARDRIGGAGFCVAVNEAGVVMGVVQGDGLDGSREARVDDAMDFGVTTVRPAEDLAALTERMRRAGVEAIVVTCSDGRLFGLLTRHEAEHALKARQAPA